MEEEEGKVRSFTSRGGRLYDSVYTLLFTRWNESSVVFRWSASHVSLCLYRLCKPEYIAPY